MSGFDNAKVDEEFFGAGVDREGMCENMWAGTALTSSPGNVKETRP